MKHVKSTFLLIALFLTATAYGQKTINKTFTGVKSIRIEIGSGSGVVKKGSSDEVRITVEHDYDDDEYEPQFEQRGDRLIIDEDFRRSRRGRWSSRGSSEWTIEIPDGMELDYSVGSGSIEIDGLTLDLDANAGSGSIELSDVNGNLDVNSGSGSIRASNLEGELDANTGSGSIRLRDIKADLDLNTGSGSIRLEEAEGGFRLNTGSGSIDASGLSITGNSSFNTGSGRAEVELAAELNHDISVNTGSGDATLDFNGTKIEGEIIMEADKRRGRISAPFDFDKEYDEDSGWRDNRKMVKEAKIGSKNIRIRVSTGSGDATIRK